MNVVSRVLSALPIVAALFASQAEAAVTFDWESYSDGDVVSGWQPGTMFNAFDVSGEIESGMPGADGNVLKLTKEPASPAPWSNSYMRLGFTHVSAGDEGWDSYATLMSFDVFVTNTTTFFFAPNDSQVIPIGTWITLDERWGGRQTLGFRSLGDVYIDNAVINESYAAVPEPGTWALLITGFGLAGAALRRRRPDPLNA
jgi:hypothetical protein